MLTINPSTRTPIADSTSMSSTALRHRSKSLTRLLCSVTLTRTMGGGPRTFPGGLSKWQFKHMHEKLAREKERRLLQQEKQIYESRLRTEIRAKLAGKSIYDDPTASSAASAASAGGGGRMSSKDHIRALADRFMKEGAEDLWNENDGPIRAQPRPRSTNLPLPKPFDLRKIVTEKGAPVGSLEHSRHYSSWSRNVSSNDDEDGNLGSVALVEGGLLKFQDGGGRRVEEALRFQRFIIDEDSEKDSEHGDGGAARKKMMSSAALKEYAVKMNKRRPRRPDIEENDLSRELQEFHEGMRSRSALENGKKREEVTGESLLTQKRFDECNISPLTIKALSSAGYVNMTVVQEATLPVCLEGKDVLVKAKTGTGKSAAFLLPAIEAVVRGSSTTSTFCMPPILVLILSPTRELAIQLAAEANVLLKHHDGVGIQKLIGGTRFKLDQKHLEENPCQIIVATPGRLLDHIENKSGFSARLLGLKMIILDEADHLLDLGFRKDVEKIADCIPRQRQSLLFSATIPRKVRRVSQLLLKRDHIFVDTVGLGCIETHEKVVQSYFVAPHELHFHLVLHILSEHTMRVSDYKVIVFCTTAMVTAFMYVLLRDLKMNVREMHSRKPQLYRTRISDEFRESKCLILVTSDVSARGMNYPDVTLVIQVGIPPDREQYIHRLGRTGREGKDGEGILLLAPWEEYFMNEINDLPLERCQLPELGLDMKQKVERSIEKIDLSIKEAAYHAWLGYYNSIGDIGRDKTTLVELANRFCQSIGLDRPPALFRKTVLKMGLKNIPGIRIRK